MSMRIFEREKFINKISLFEPSYMFCGICNGDLVFVIAACTIVPSGGGRLGGVAGVGAGVVSALSAAVCAQELGAKIVVTHITRAVGGVAVACA